MHAQDFTLHTLVPFYSWRIFEFFACSSFTLQTLSTTSDPFWKGCSGMPLYVWSTRLQAVKAPTMAGTSKFCPKFMRSFSILNLKWLKLKPWQNKKDQTLLFAVFCCRQLIQIQIQRTSTSTNIWPFLFC